MFAVEKYSERKLFVKLNISIIWIVDGRYHTIYKITLVNKIKQQERRKKKVWKERAINIACAYSVECIW